MNGSKVNEVYQCLLHNAIVPSSFGEDFREKANKMVCLKEIIKSSICLQSFICNDSNSKCD